MSAIQARPAGRNGGLEVAGLQLDLTWEDPPANFARARAAIAKAAQSGARLVALPEMFATGFSMNAQAMSAFADETAAFLSAEASRHGIHVIGGFADRPASGLATEGGGLPRNAAAIYGPDGAEKARYHKIHPFSLANEHKHFGAGERVCTVDVEGVRVSVLICYDLRFPEVFRAVADRTDLYVVIANWPEPRREAWSTLLKARAIENQCFVLGINRVGEGSGLRYTGDSAFHGPLGEARSTASVSEATVGGVVDPEEVADIRRRFSFLADRRPEVYSRLT